VIAQVCWFVCFVYSLVCSYVSLFLISRKVSLISMKFGIDHVNHLFQMFINCCESKVNIQSYLFQEQSTHHSSDKM